MPADHTFTCATCDHVIAGHPVFHVGLAFCCPGCAADGPCMCSYDGNIEAPAVVPFAAPNPVEKPAVVDEPVRVTAKAADVLAEPVGARR